MKLVSTQTQVAGGDILGLNEAEAKAALLRFFSATTAASQSFLLGMAMDLAKEDPRPKSMRGALAAPLALAFG